MKNKIKVISLFSGGGGLDLGFINQGYEIVWANDSDKNAVATYKKNLGDHIIHKDINDIEINSLPSADVVIGGPPCQSFSLSGNRNPDDVRGQLVWKYLDIIEALEPKGFIFENVIGLKSAKDADGNLVLPQLQHAFKSIGYTVSTKVLNAANYGVPQKRKRLFVVGLKNNREFEFPEILLSEEDFISVKDALSDLPEASTTDKQLENYKSANTPYQLAMRKNTKIITEHTIPTMSELDEYIIKHVKPGGNYMDIPPTVPSKRIKRLQKEGGRTTFYGRMDPEKSSYTINTYFNRPNGGCFIHYSHDRLITTREALRLQSFPDSYQLVSSSQHGKRTIVGNAVPPLLAETIAQKFKKYIGG